MDRLRMRVGNITQQRGPCLDAHDEYLPEGARVLTSGKLELRAQGYPLAKVPTFNADFTSSGIDLPNRKALLKKLPK